MKTLFRLLLELIPEPNHEIGKELGLSPCNISRLCNGLTNRRKSLERASAYLSRRLKVAVDPALLLERIEPAALVAVALHLRSKRLTGMETP